MCKIKYFKCINADSEHQLLAIELNIYARVRILFFKRAKRILLICGVCI